MSLDVLLEPVPERKLLKPLCKVGRIVSELDAVYQLAVVDMLGKTFVDGGLTDEEVEDRFKRAGLPVSASVINRHRKSRCNCV